MLFNLTNVLDKHMINFMSTQFQLKKSTIRYIVCIKIKVVAIEKHFVAAWTCILKKEECYAMDSGRTQAGSEKDKD